MVFIGHHDDVVAALGGHPLPGPAPADDGATSPGDSPAQCPFSVAHYLQASREITRGDALILAMDPGEPLGAERARRLRILNQAWYANPWSNFATNHEVRDFIRDAVGLIEQRVARSGHIDVLQDLAFYIPHLLVERYVGLPGPDFLSDLVVALPFAKRYITKLPPDWLEGRQSPSALDPGYATMQMWSRLSFAEVIGNIQHKQEFTEAAIQATSELLTYIDEKIVEARRDPKRRQGTVLDALIRQAPDFIAADFDEDAYFAEVRAILADLMVTISINIGLPFSKAIQAALLFGFDCSRLVGLLDTLPQIEGYDNIELLAYELLRLYPSAPAIFRRCEANTTLPSGATIRSGEWIAAILAIAGLDPHVFPCRRNSR